MIAGHVAHFDAAGHLLPWISWTTALEREMLFYQQCPTDHGYPRFVSETFLEGDWSLVPDRRDTIPATQNGMGILSYLKLYALRDGRDAIYLDTARAMGDYLVREALTPALGRYPRFTRSTGTRGQFPLAADAGSQGDHPYEIEPDKGGIAGYALVLLFEASGERKYLEQGLVHFVRRTFTHLEFGVRVCHEQDEDREAWGGVNSTYGAVLALYAKAVGSALLASEARQALNFTLYSIDDAGRPRDLFKRALPGGWQEDAHTDVIHNYVDALRAFPAWAEAH